jgi:hypothetical protein
VQFLIRTSAKFTIAHKPALFLTGPTGVLFFPLAKQWWPFSVKFPTIMPHYYPHMAVILGCRYG